MIDAEGFRLNVGIILTNANRRIFWGKRIGQDAWQFPQGGVNEGETPEQTLYRELKEEVGLSSDDVEILASTDDWLEYRLPHKYIRHYSHPLCIGQRQKWFLLRLTSDDNAIELDASEKPEFDEWRWVYYWYPLRKVIAFKREVYRLALKEFEPIIFPNKSRRKESA